MIYLEAFLLELYTVFFWHIKDNQKNNNVQVILNMNDIVIAFRTSHLQCFALLYHQINLETTSKPSRKPKRLILWTNLLRLPQENYKTLKD